MATLVFRGGTVFDGLGSPGRRADVLVTDGRVREIGHVDRRRGVREVDCAGRYVAPGFIDAHSHSDLLPLMDTPQPFKLLQGVTTEVAGNCGISFAPLTAEGSRLAADIYGKRTGGVPIIPRSFTELLAEVERCRPTNHLAYLVGHGTLRLSANGADARLRRGALAEMTRLAVQAFEAGAVGLSTGLVHPPGCFADQAELEQLARVAGAYGSTYATHMRNEGRFVESALDEAIAVAKAGGTRLQVSHCKAAGASAHGLGQALIRKLQRARLDGVDLAGDQYPYLAGSTVMISLLPNRAAAGGVDETIARLTDPASRNELREHAARGKPGDGMWANTTPGQVLITDHDDPAVVGRTLAEVAGGRDAYDVLCELVIQDPAAGIVLEMMSEEDVREIMASPLVGVGSDNGPPQGLQHPRTYGCFPRFLGTYVRELAVLSWEEALRKATSLTARQFGLTGRGMLLPGCHADITVFDPTTIGHPGTYLEPGLPVTGIYAVTLEGQAVVEDGGYTGERAGRVLRRSY